jgi:tetratricopeptide (TPR) repeat protein
MRTTLKPCSLVTTTLLLSLVSFFPLVPNSLGNLGAIAQEPTPQSGNRFPRPNRSVHHGTILLDDDNSLSNQQAEAMRLYQEGIEKFKQEQFQEALETFQQVLEIYKEFGDCPNNHSCTSRRGEGRTLNSIGGTYYTMGRYPQSLEFYQQALVIRREVGDKLGEARTLHNLGLVFRKAGSRSQAQEYLEQALKIFQEIGDRTGLQETRQALSSLKPCATCMLVVEGTVLLDDEDNHIPNQQQGTNPAVAADHPINDSDEETSHGTILRDDDDNDVSNQQQGSNSATAADHPINDTDEETSPSEINEHPIPSWLNPNGRGRILKPSGTVLHDDDDDDVSNQQQGTNPPAAADHPINETDEETNPSEINEHPRPSGLNPDRNRWILKPSGTVLQDDDDNPQPQSPQSRPPQRR